MTEPSLSRLAFPLNVFAEALRLEYGLIDELHLGIMAPGDPSPHRAQARAT